MDKVSVQAGRGTDSCCFQKPKLSCPLKNSLFYKDVFIFAKNKTRREKPEQ